MGVRKMLNNTNSDDETNGYRFRARTESGFRTFITKDYSIVNIEYPHKIEDGKRVYVMLDIEFLETMLHYG